MAQTPSFLSGVTAKLDFKLPFVSGGLSGTNTTNNVSSVERLEKKLRKEYQIPSHDKIPRGSAPVFISFKGRAVRTVQDSEFWIAVDHDHTPLLLGGSAAFALGAKPKEDQRISPSADPVGAFVRAFKESQKAAKDPDVTKAISYIWTTIVSDAFRSHADLPNVEGLAIYATSVRATRDVADVRRPNVSQIIVGTPLFVRQCEEPHGSKLSPADHLVEHRKRYLVQVSALLDFDRAYKHWKKVGTFVYKLHCLGYRVLDGAPFSNGDYLSEYRKAGRWDRAFVLYRPENYELAAQIRSSMDEENDFPAELISIDEVVNDNGEQNQELIDDNADVAIAICLD